MISLDQSALTARIAAAVDAERDRVIADPQALVRVPSLTGDEGAAQSVVANLMERDTRLQERPGLAMVLNADGFGTQELKRVKYHAFTSSPRRVFGEGFKLFYREDTKLMTPRQVLRLKPPPDVVVYE